MAHLSPTMLDHARHLRRAQTRAEHKVWWWLRDRKLGVKFRRQVPIGPYILDFFCAELKLAIELDGGKHSTPDMADYDSERTIYLRAQGIEVVRIPNHLTDGDGGYAFAMIEGAVARLNPE